MRIRFIALALLVATLPAAADTPACNRAFNGFADELDALADKYDKIEKTDELCRFMRSTGTPLYQSIADRSQGLVGKCERGAEALAFARTKLKEETVRMNEVCAKAGM
jgi:hypothetical protein